MDKGQNPLGTACKAAKGGGEEGDACASCNFVFSLSDKGVGGRRLSDCRIGLGRAVGPRLLRGICIPRTLSHDMY